MDSQYAAPDLAILDTADRVGRAAYLWLHQRAVPGGTDHPPNGPFGGPPVDERRAQFLAAGFISQLCDTLQLTSQHGLLAAYAYALLDGNDSNTLEIATILFDFRTTRQASNVFEEGRSMAGDMLEQLDNSGYKAIPEDGFCWPAPRFAC